ncbi:MAG TPA: universal stress protein [Steroidobacter sp.]|nr:universal stress protein [Steroidobacteraceae bacterium]HLS81334.1 universal stress protein [Steroidobacter sp.]
MQQRDAKMYKKILVPVDGSAASNRGLAEALKLAQAVGAQVRIVHAVNELIMDSGYAAVTYHDDVIQSLRETGRKTLEQARDAAQAQGLKVETELVETLGGRAADVIIDQVKQWSADLIVMGTHGRRGVRRLVMGSDAELVLRMSPVPVLLVRESEEK